jgi:hypothetical protein
MHIVKLITRPRYRATGKSAIGLMKIMKKGRDKEKHDRKNEERKEEIKARKGKGQRKDNNLKPKKERKK